MFKRPPRVKSGSRSDIWQLFSMGYKVRRLGKKNMRELLRVIGLNIADDLEDNIESNTLNSIEGATALKLDEKFEINEQEQHSLVNNYEQSAPEAEIKNDVDNIPTGVSIENASYIENNEDSSLLEKADEKPSFDVELSNNEEEYTPQLFSHENESQVESGLDEFSNNEHTEKLFDQDSSEEEDFEIPAFLRKQKF